MVAGLKATCLSRELSSGAAAAGPSAHPLTIPVQRGAADDHGRPQIFSGFRRQTSKRAAGLCVRECACVRASACAEWSAPAVLSRSLSRSALAPFLKLRGMAPAPPATKFIYISLSRPACVRAAVASAGVTRRTFRGRLGSSRRSSGPRRRRCGSGPAGPARPRRNELVWLSARCETRARKQRAASSRDCQPAAWLAASFARAIIRLYVRRYVRGSYQVAQLILAHGGAGDSAAAAGRPAEGGRAAAAGANQLHHCLSGSAACVRVCVHAQLKKRPMMARQKAISIRLAT
jgi:hypothetical protein